MVGEVPVCYENLRATMEAVQAGTVALHRVARSFGITLLGIGRSAFRARRTLMVG